MKLPLILTAVLLCPLTFAKSTRPRKLPVGPPHETEAQKEDVRLYALDSLIKAWNENIHSGKDMNLLLPKTLDEKKRKDFLATAEAMGPAPTITRDDHNLTFELANVKAVLHWPHLGRTKMTIGGIDFVYDTSVSVAQNMKMFDQRMGIYEASAANPLELFLPRADAANPIKVFELLTKSKAGEWIVSGIKKIKCSSSICNTMFTFTGFSAFASSNESKCWMFAFAGFHPWAWTGHPLCLEWKKTQDTQQALSTTTRLKQTAEADGKTWAARGWQCPKIDKDTYEFTSWMRQVQVIDDTHSQELGTWRFMKAKFSHANNPKLIDLQVFASEEESKSKDVNAALYKLTFDPDSTAPQLTSIMSRADKASPDDPDYNPITLKDADSEKYLAIWGQKQSLAEGTLKSYNVCQYVKFMKQFDPSGVKSDLQSALANPGAPVPAAGSSEAQPAAVTPPAEAKK